MGQHDPDVKVRVSRDGLTAVLEEIPAREAPPGGGGKLLERALVRAGVCRGLDKEAVGKVLSRLTAGSRVPETVVARGRPAVAARDGRIEFLVALEREEIGTRDKSGHIDFRDKGRLPQVREGQDLARLIPPRAGKPGLTVTGRRLDPGVAKAARLRAGKNVIRSEDLFTATRDGLLVEVEPGKLAVLEILDLEAVDNESGHIEFSGLVRVSGGVAGGFKVKAGALQASNLEAETHVEVEESVTIKDPILGAELKAGGTVVCSLVRKSGIECGGDLLVTTEIVDSKIKAGGRIRLISPEGRIVNSDLTVGRGIETGKILSKGKSPSRVPLGLKTDSGQNPEADLEELMKSRKEVAASLDKVASELREWGEKWRRNRDPDLAARIRRKGEVLKELRRKAAEVSARIREAADRAEAGGAYLSVRDSADSGLIIMGRKTSLTLDKPTPCFNAREILRTDPDTGRERWVIAILDPRISPV